MQKEIRFFEFIKTDTSTLKTAHVYGSHGECISKLNHYTGSYIWGGQTHTDLLKARIDDKTGNENLPFLSLSYEKTEMQQTISYLQMYKIKMPEIKDIENVENISIAVFDSELVVFLPLLLFEGVNYDNQSVEEMFDDMILVLDKLLNFMKLNKANPDEVRNSLVNDGGSAELKEFKLFCSRFTDHILLDYRNLNFDNNEYEFHGLLFHAILNSVLEMERNIDELRENSDSECKIKLKIGLLKLCLFFEPLLNLLKDINLLIRELNDINVQNNNIEDNYIEDKYKLIITIKFKASIVEQYCEGKTAYVSQIKDSFEIVDLTNGANNYLYVKRGYDMLVELFKSLNPDMKLFNILNFISTQIRFNDNEGYAFNFDPANNFNETKSLFNNILPRYAILVNAIPYGALHSAMTTLNKTVLFNQYLLNTEHKTLEYFLAFLHETGHLGRFGSCQGFVGLSSPVIKAGKTITPADDIGILLETLLIGCNFNILYHHFKNPTIIEELNNVECWTSKIDYIEAQAETALIMSKSLNKNNNSNDSSNIYHKHKNDSKNKYKAIAPFSCLSNTHDNPTTNLETMELNESLKEKYRDIIELTGFDLNKNYNINEKKNFFSEFRNLGKKVIPSSDNLATNTNRMLMMYQDFKTIIFKKNTKT
jgi:hypothetical protein